MTAQSQTSMILSRPASLESLSGLAVSGSLYAIVDACDAPHVPPKASAIGAAQAFCLFDGDRLEKTADAGPYLFTASESLLQWLHELSWSEPWGVLVACKEPIAVLAAHLRRFLVVQLPDGKRRSFRFYDPRILRPFLETCTRDQLRTFHGPVRAYGIASSEGADFLSEDPKSTFGANANFLTNAGLLPISPTQMDRFQQVVDEQFVDELVGHMKDKHAAEVAEWPSEVQRARAGTAIARARSYGIESTGSIRTFLSLMIQSGPNFDRHPSVNAVLKDPSIEEDLRPNAAIANLPGREWDAAKASRDDAAWNIPVWEGTER
ncbi:MAG: DUF4123 domain-containing protein [Acidobacteria bacterium]|nr:DUF4123 domain-containing protein [Acidobacteriota bacterium]